MLKMNVKRPGLKIERLGPLAPASNVPFEGVDREHPRPGNAGAEEQTLHSIAMKE